MEITNEKLYAEIQKLKKIINVLRIRSQMQKHEKKEYICRFCGHTALKPHGGRCPNSPYENKTHEFMKA